MWGLVEQIKELKLENGRLRKRNGEAMKKYLLAFVAGFVVVAAPWRLAALGVETLVMKPGPVRVAGGNGKYWDALSLEIRLIDMGWAVSYEPDLSFMGQRALGMTDPSKHLIRVDSGLSWDDRFAVLAHEGGHVLEPGWVTRAQGEIFAETVGALVARDGLREHARYLSRYKLDFLLITFMEWPAIYRAAAVLQD